jgi:sensor domain CHASE-containing protein
MPLYAITIETEEQLRESTEEQLKQSTEESVEELIADEDQEVNVNLRLLESDEA